VTTVSLANNHALDQTRDGLGETIDAARAAGLGTLGAGRSRDEAEAPLLVGASGVRVAVLAVFLRDNPEPALPDGTPRLATVDPEMLAAVRRVRQSADVVVVVVHVVAELETRPSPALRMLVDHLVDMHVDAVIAHGPHVVAPVERIGRTTVAWSIGNLLSDMGHAASPRAHHIDEHDKRQTPRTRAGLVARIEAREGEPPRVGFLPIFVRTDAFLVGHGLAGGPTDYRVVPLRARGHAMDLPRSWPEELHAASDAWLDAQRDALLRTARLRAPSHDGPPALLAP
jgi:poly-gamma-glutamate synthesis protein (capsule biosynthesis protein)